ncbi:zinc-binding protein [bacterium]|nr:zinc-binding protein [bacterium]
MNEERQMFTGNWKCSGCGGEITELPFQPDPEREGSLMCRDCHKKRRGDRPRRERQMFEGNWTCADCGGAITSLPFEPRDDSNLKCRDCFRK